MVTGRLSVVVPVFNEVDYLLPILDKVQSAVVNGLEKEIIVVDDYSTDGTRDLLQSIRNATGLTTFEHDGNDEFVELDVDEITVLFNDQNHGKGYSLRRGFEESNGEFVVVQDADLEYDPDEYSRLLEPIQAGKADVVYGSRFLGGPHRVLYFWHYLGNRTVTLLSNMLTNLNLTDMETCYKMFKQDVLQSIELKQNRFGFEPEFTAKVAREGYRVYEVPISYYGRTYEEGKKITWKDGITAVWCIMKYNCLPWT
ncbi:MAG: glycosyltransferase family 2 protein [bacterium]